MKYVIGLDPNRRVTRSKNRGIAKFAVVNGSRKSRTGWRWSRDVNEATVFDSFAAANQAYGARCRKLRKDPSTDVVFYEADIVRPTTQRVELGKKLNGGGRY
jgi:hypothetical protein